MLGENQKAEEAATEEVESTEVDNNDISAPDDDTASIDDHNDDQDDSSSDDNENSEDESHDDSIETSSSKGLDKRLKKVLERDQRKDETIADLKMKLWEVEQKIAMSHQAPQQQYQQQPAQPDPRLDPASAEFDLHLYTNAIVSQQIQAQQQQQKVQESAKTVLNDYSSVEKKLMRARALDSNFDKAMETYGALLTPDIKYGLSVLERPESFLKHVFKSEKDVRAFQQLSQRHPFDQVKTVVKQGTEFELRSKGVKSNAPSTPKPKPPIPQFNKGRNTSKPVFDSSTGRFDANWVNDWISR